MRVRRFALAVAALAPIVGLAACGGASEEEFCSTWNAMYNADAAGVEMVDEREGLEDLYRSVPDDADDDVKDAADFLADNHSGTAELREQVDSGELSDAEEDEIFAAMATIREYSETTCAL
jgi:hypothetical protein